MSIFSTLEAGEKKTGQVTYQVMVMEVKTEKSYKEKTIGRSQIELSLNVSIWLVMGSVYVGLS